MKLGILCFMYWGESLMWLIVLLVKDPKGSVRAALAKKM